LETTRGTESWQTLLRSSGGRNENARDIRYAPMCKIAET
jgi:hypothetical protein